MRGVCVIGALQLMAVSAALCCLGVEAFASEVCVMAAASLSDVRWRYAPPFGMRGLNGAMPRKTGPQPRSHNQALTARRSLAAHPGAKPKSQYSQLQRHSFRAQRSGQSPQSTSSSYAPPTRTTYLGLADE